MRLAKYGLKEIIRQGILSILGAACIVALSMIFETKVLLPLISIPVIWFLFILYFFRDPNRSIPEGDNSLVSPADGTVVEISESEENSFLKTKVKKLGIFLSLFSVHINRSPCKGKVVYLNYTPGRFLNAGNPDSSRINENNAVGIETDKCKMLLRQISGVIARRIVCETKEGDVLEKGEKFGMIKFGSRTEVYLPINSDVEIKVKIGQKVKAGETVLGVFK
ncbi:MAG: phosphatidylserine decarboxylase family protein [Planctomycetota bacterium]